MLDMYPILVFYQVDDEAKVYVNDKLVHTVGLLQGKLEEYILKDLQPGDNTIKLVATNPIGSGSAWLQVELRFDGKVYRTWQYGPKHVTGDFFNETVTVSFDEHGFGIVTDTETIVVPATRSKARGKQTDEVLWGEMVLRTNGDEKLKISATGLVSVHGGDPEKVDKITPKGHNTPIEHRKHYLAPGENLGALVGRYTESHGKKTTSTFLVGDNLLYVTPANGELFLAVNDSTDNVYYDNTGEFKVTIQKLT